MRQVRNNDTLEEVETELGKDINGLKHGSKLDDENEKQSC